MTKISTGVYVLQKRNSERSPKWYWVVRIAIPKSVRKSQKAGYKDYYAQPNTERAAKRLAALLLKDRPSYRRGGVPGKPRPRRKTP